MSSPGYDTPAQQREDSSNFISSKSVAAAWWPRLGRASLTWCQWSAAAEDSDSSCLGGKSTDWAASSSGWVAFKLTWRLCQCSSSVYYANTHGHGSRSEEHRSGGQARQGWTVPLGPALERPGSLSVPGRFRVTVPAPRPAGRGRGAHQIADWRPGRARP